MSIERKAFGQTPEGPAELFCLKNAAGMEAHITNWGGIVTALHVPDAQGRLADVVLGYDTIEEYLGHNRFFFGALIGRYAGRIAAGHFSLDGKAYALAVNNGPNHLHGGLRGFDKVLWRAEAEMTRRGPRLALEYTSADGEEGYPGEVRVSVHYTLTPENELRIDYTATTTAPTVLNLTNHSYFNLAGAGSESVLSHRLTLHADRFAAVDAHGLVTGEIRPVAGTPFDFTAPQTLGARIDQDDEQLRCGSGYDHDFLLPFADDTLSLAARLEDPSSGRVLEVFTTEPSCHLYTGNFIEDLFPGKGGARYRRFSGVCLETQHLPDAPNRPAFPSTELRPGNAFCQTTVFKFSAH